MMPGIDFKEGHVCHEAVTWTWRSHTILILIHSTEDQLQHLKHTRHATLLNDPFDPACAGKKVQGNNLT